MNAPQPYARFRPSQRLRVPAEFRRVMDAPTLRASHSGFVLLALENGLSQGRLGFVLPKRRLRLAVARNRVKRIIRESFRHHQATLAGLDIVVMARDGLAALKPAELRAIADRQFLYLAGKKTSASVSPDRSPR